jgi:hypothetical protein
MTLTSSVPRDPIDLAGSTIGSRVAGVVGLSAGFPTHPRGGSALVLKEEARRDASEYGQRMRRLGGLAKTYAVEVVIVLLVLVGMVDTVFRYGSAGSPSTSLWFALPAMAVLAIVIVAHRRFPFAGPAAYWLLAAAIAFVDPILLPSAESFFAVGLATAFLLGNLRDARKAGIGLAIILASTAILVSLIPGHTTAEVFFIPLDFAICWFAGFMLHVTADRPKPRRRGRWSPSTIESKTRSVPSSRNAPASRASCTTSSGTASA